LGSVENSGFRPKGLNPEFLFLWNVKRSGVRCKKWGVFDVWICFCYRFENRGGYRGWYRCSIGFIILVDEEHIPLHLQVEHYPGKTEYEVVMAL